MSKTIQDIADGPQLGVSVVICGKNEEVNFAQNLPKILEQDHSNFELVVVDDHSIDGSANVLSEMAEQDKRITYIEKRLVPDKPGKKAALQVGIQQSKHDYIVVTDADCFPASKNWLALMTRPLANDYDLVLGLSPHIKSQGWLNALIRFETYFTALQYGGFALAGMPYMGVGRNMAYRKDFYKAPEIGQLASGDDDLLVNAQANRETTYLQRQKESFTFSNADSAYSSWLRQKMRHQSAGIEYKRHHIFLLVLFSLTFLLSTIGFIVLLFSMYLWPTLLAFLILSLIKVLVHVNALPKFGITDFNVLSPLLELLWALHLPLVSIGGQLRKKKKWN